MIFRQLALHVANLACFFLPQSRAYKAKAFLFSCAGVEVGRSVKINGTARIHYPNAKIGSDTWIGPGCQLIPTNRHAVTVGANCDIAPNVVLAAGSHVIGTHERRAGDGTASAPVSVGDGCWVGAGVTFIAGSSIGDGSIVAAGAVVTKKFGPDVLVGGVPARVIRTLSRN